MDSGGKKKKIEPSASNAPLQLLPHRGVGYPGSMAPIPLPTGSPNLGYVSSFDRPLDEIASLNLSIILRVHVPIITFMQQIRKQDNCGFLD